MATCGVTTRWKARAQARPFLFVEEAATPSAAVSTRGWLATGACAHVIEGQATRSASKDRVATPRVCLTCSCLAGQNPRPRLSNATYTVTPRSTPEPRRSPKCPRTPALRPRRVRRRAGMQLRNPAVYRRHPPRRPNRRPRPAPHAAHDTSPPGPPSTHPPPPSKPSAGLRTPSPPRFSTWV